MVRIEQTSADAIYRGLTMLAMNDQISFNSRAEIMNEVYANMVKSKPEQFDLNNLQFYFFDGYDEELSQFGKDLMKYIKSGRLKAYWKDRSADALKGEGVPLAMFDEMHEYPSGPMYTIKLKDNANSKSLLDKLYKMWNKEKSNLVFEPTYPTGGMVYPDAGRFEIEPTEEAAKKVLEASGYTVIKTDELNKELDDYPLTKRQLNQIEMHVENMLGKKVMEMQHRLDMNYRHNTKDIADKVKNEIAKELKENRLKGGLK